MRGGGGGWGGGLEFVSKGQLLDGLVWVDAVIWSNKSASTAEYIRFQNQKCIYNAICSPQDDPQPSLSTFAK